MAEWREVWDLIGYHYYLEGDKELPWLQHGHGKHGEHKPCSFLLLEYSTLSYSMEEGQAKELWRCNRVWRYYLRTKSINIANLFKLDDTDHQETRI